MAATQGVNQGEVQEGGDGQGDDQAVVPEVHHEEEVESQEEEGAVGGQELEDDKEDNGEDEDDKDEDEDDAVDELIASGQIKLKASCKWVMVRAYQAGRVDLGGRSGVKRVINFNLFFL